MTIQPFYVSKDCLCEGSTKVFLASDLENLIRERMKKFDNLTMYEGSANVYVLLELESLLAVLNPSNEKVSTP